MRNGQKAEAKNEGKKRRTNREILQIHLLPTLVKTFRLREKYEELGRSDGFSRSELDNPVGGGSDCKQSNAT